MARRRDYDETTGDEICQRVMDGETLRQVCEDEAMPARSTVHKWLASNSTFADQYARAMEARAEHLFDELFDIADDGQNDWMERKDSEGDNIGWRENGEAIRRSALRIDTRKWALSKMLPKKYGDKLAIGGDSEMDPIKTESVSEVELARQVAFLLAKGVRAE